MPTNNSPFVSSISLDLSEKLKNDLKNQGFEILTPEYTLFAAKKAGVSLTLYQSGKLVVQGKDKDDFIRYYLEPEILSSLEYTYPTLNLDLTPRIGVDEAGKGDFFGPLCIASLYADAAGIELLVKTGIKDSKKLSDVTIKKLAKTIKAAFQHKIIIIYPQKYNELYAKFHNLNSLLAWGHATAIDQLVKESKCTKVIIDKFANESVVERAVEQKSIKIQLTQVTQGEADPVVAGASILARDAFVSSLERFESQYNFIFPKGASGEVVKAGKQFVNTFGKHELHKVAKLHFKTANEL